MDFLTSEYVVLRMPLYMWLPNLDTGTPMKWGVKHVPKNQWVAGPYDTQAYAERVCKCIEESEHA